MTLDTAVRRRVAQLALDLFDGRITDKQFFTHVDGLPPAEDAQVTELVQLVRHAGARSWFFGLGRRSVSDDGDRIGQLVSELLGDGGASSSAGARDAEPEARA